MKFKYLTIFFVIFAVFLSFLLFFAYQANHELQENYLKNESVVIKDRFGKIITFKPNSRGYYSEYLEQIPPDFEKLLLKKEDNYFYYHLGFNPFSISRAVYRKITGATNLASSTITQQLVKILLQNEQERNFKNKLKELFYAFSLELFTPKEKILKMYLNSVYLGTNIQGVKLASLLYFDKDIVNLTEDEIIRLIVTIESPSVLHPFSLKNSVRSQEVSEKLGLDLNFSSPTLELNTALTKKFFNELRNPLQFESEYFSKKCEKVCELTLDRDLNQEARLILEKNLLLLADKNVKNGAIVVIKIPENELITLVGSPNPTLKIDSAQINMAFQPRPIGSTLKPFIYLKGFEKGLRPYTLVNDQEYRYLIESGFAFYPKNYDYQYHGIVDLHYALSNSLNVPAVKVLEFVGQNDFRKLLLNEFKIPEVQPLSNYGIGLALGQLELNLLNLAYLFTIFPNEGNLSPLKVAQTNNDKVDLPEQFILNSKISSEKYIQLVNKILTDRNTAIDQFGLKSSLNFPNIDVALKTGTSREYHDSFVVGYTPDVLVAVWLGNAENTPMDEVSGQTGAGLVFQEVMNLILNSKYNQKHKFKFDELIEFRNQETLGLEFGLKGDQYDVYRHLLQENALILKPHNNDVFMLTENTEIPITCNQECTFYVNDEVLFTGKEGVFTPKEIGEYRFKAVSGEKIEEIKVILNEDNNESN